MRKLFFIFLGVITLNVVYANSCGGQFDPTTGTCRIIGPDGRQILYNSAPPQSGRSTPSPKKIIRYTTVYLPDKYGAITLDRKTNAVSSSANKYLKRSKDSSP